MEHLYAMRGDPSYLPSHTTTLDGKELTMSDCKALVMEADELTSEGKRMITAEVQALHELREAEGATGMLVVL